MPRTPQRTSTNEALNKLGEGSLKDRVTAIKEITEIFWVERAVYLTVTVISLVMLLVCAGVALVRGQFDQTQRMLTSSAGGVFVASGSSVLYMWNRALTIALRLSE